MSIKSFLLGIVTGAILTFAGLFIYAISTQKSDSKELPIKYLEKAVSYEGKKTTTFKVFQVFDNAALANEASDRIGDEEVYFGNIVIIQGENFYNNQVIRIKNPQRIGTYSYTTTKGMPMTVPIVDGDKE